MTTARVILTIPALSLAAAEDMANRFENDFRIEPLAVTINETDEAKNLWETVAYFATEAEAEEAQRLLQLPSGIVSTLPDTDWVKHSLEGLAPVVAGRFFLHGSHDRERRRHGGVSLEIDAGTAFGTGHHGTTAGCLLALDAILKRRRPDAFWISAAARACWPLPPLLPQNEKHSPPTLTPEAVRVTELNAKLNDVTPLLRGVTAPGLKHNLTAHGAPYDLIFANILALPLISLAQGLTSILAPGGNLILSGLTRDQMRWVLAAYRNRGLIPAQTLLLRQLGHAGALPTKENARKHFRFGRLVSGAVGKGWEEA